MCKVLIFGCIAAVLLMSAAYGTPLQTTKSPTTKEVLLAASIQDLKLLKDIDNDFLDFYTPNDKRECNHTTLACFLKELNVLKQDVEEKDRRPFMHIEQNLKTAFKDLDFSNPTCKKCESHEKKKFAEFHQEMMSFLQSMLKEIL